MPSIQVFHVSDITAKLLTTDTGVFRVWPNGSIEVKIERQIGGEIWLPFSSECYDYDVGDALRKAALNK